MLPTTQRNDFINGYSDTVKMLGTTFNHIADDTAVAINTIAHFVDMKAQDEHLVNAVGIEARILHTLATPIIRKYDTMTAPSGIVYTVHVSHEIYVNDTLVGFKLVVMS